MPTPIIVPHNLSKDPGLRTVHIKIPGRVAFDLKSMHRVTETILGRLGCPGCHSGFDLRFDFIDEFIVDEELNVDAFEHGARTR